VDREYVRRFEAARTPEQLATQLIDPVPEQERALRTYLGDDRFHRQRALALALGTSRGPARARGNVVVLHGIMGSELTVFDEPNAPVLVWLSYLRLYSGWFARLRLDAAGENPFEDGVHYHAEPTNILNKYYGELLLRLRQNWNTFPFCYDWRKTLAVAAADLEHFLRRQFHGQPVTLVAHSMGGLVARTLLLSRPMATDPESKPLVERLVMLGTPNYGSFEVPLIFAGIQDTVRLLIRLTGGVGGLFNEGPARQRLLDVVDTFPGVYQMLPWAGAPGASGEVAKLYEPTTYAGFNAGVTEMHLKAAADHHRRLNEAPLDTDRMVYVAGFGLKTVNGIRSAGRLTEPANYTTTLAGDGTVPHVLGFLPGVRPCFVQAAHADLASDRKVLAAIDELVASDGHPNLPGPAVWPVDRAVEERDLSQGWDEKVRRERENVEDLLRRLRRRDEEAGVRAFSTASAPAPRLSPDESELEELLVAPFLGGRKAAPAPPVAAVSPPGIRVRLLAGKIEECQDQLRDAAPPVDAVAGGVYVGVKPIGGVKALDASITAALAPVAGEAETFLTELIVRGTVRGDLGVPFLLPDPREPPRVIALAGLGEPGGCGLPELTLSLRELCWTLGRLGKRHLATLLIGSGAGNLSVEDATRALLDAAADALASARAAGDRGRLQQITIVEYYPDRLRQIAEALLVAQGQLAGRLDVDFTLTDAEREDFRRRELEWKKRELENQLRSLEPARTAGEERPDREPIPTRVTFTMGQGVCTFAAVTDTASIPERTVEVDTTLVEQTNDLLVAAVGLDDQKQLGRVLGRLLIPRDLRDEFETAAPLVMQVDARSARAHWEMVVQDALGQPGSAAGEFLGLARGFTRQLRTAFAPPPEPPPQAGRRLRVLIVADPAADARLAGAAEEGAEVAELFEAFNRAYGGGVEVVRLFGPSEATRIDVLCRVMLESFDLLHFAGHCFFDPNDPPGSGWLFHRNPRQVLSARELRRCDRVPRFVFANACESGVTPDRPEERQAALVPSFAEAFFEQGVANFIATAWPVDDFAARLFARHVYANLLGLVVDSGRTLAVSGSLPPRPLHVALREARRAVQQATGGARTWGAYQHYGNPYARFFAADLHPATGAAPAARSASEPAAAPVDPRFAPAHAALLRHAASLRGLDERVLEVRLGYQFDADGWITDRPAVVVVVRPDASGRVGTLRQPPPAEVDGVPVDVALATPVEQLDAAGLRSDTARPVFPEDDLLRPGQQAVPASVPAGEERGATVPYHPAQGAHLTAVKDAMTVTCHVSPDQGWGVLGEFLSNTRERLTVGMYDFSAPHIRDKLEEALGGAGKHLRLVLDPGLALANGGDAGHNPKAHDVDEDQVRAALAGVLDGRFDFVWAAVKHTGKTTAGIFPSAYHIKVAVRDGTAFWLSSGNWQSSNQPSEETFAALATSWAEPAKLLAACNREWHVVVEHEKLAATFEAFLKSDFDQAEPLQDRGRGPAAVEALPDLLLPEEPELTEERGRVELKRFDVKPFAFTNRRKLEVQPLLTPDNFAEHALKLIQSARKSLYFQNQYINLSAAPDPKFAELIDALREKVNDDDLDVKVIVRDLPNTRAMLEALQAGGFNLARFRVQKACHTKGVIVDSKVVLIGSHNWSSQGTTHNRDASLIFFNEQIAGYFQKVFLHDWEGLARKRVSAQRAMPRLAGRERGEEAIPDGTARVPWGLYYED
jgi:pimeloyl-ACP methyl ester carboxylesterase